MATAGPPSSSSFLPLLESLEDGAAGQSEQTDAYLTIANRLSGEEGRQFLPAVEKHFSRLGKTILAHITSPNAELSQAALQALGFCVYHSHVVSRVPDILSALCSLVGKSTDKNTCTRALWVISKQSFPPDVPSILGTLESVWSREDIQSVVMEHEALNVVIRLLEQVPVQMGDGAVRWAKLVIPLVVHSASKVRLRAAAAMEMGMPLLLEKQIEVAAIIEPMMSSKLIPELQKLFMSKNETNVLKLWPLFVKLLGKMLHRGGPFINSLLHLEELGFRSSSPTVKKIAFIAWKSLIDNFSLNPDILSSAKRMKLLMQPLMSINVRTEALLLTKVEVWWYLVVQLGPNLLSNFDQVSVPVTPSRAVTQNGAATPGTPKTGFNSSANTSRMSLNSSVQVPSTFPSIQLLGLEMLLHYFLGPEAVAAAAKRKLLLSLEPLNHPLLSGASSFTKHAAVLVSNVRDGFTNIGKDAPVGSKKDRQGCEVLTLMLQALQSIVASEALPADRVLVLLEATVTGIPQRVLGSASYQVGKMDVLNGTPALFLILLLYNSSMLSAYIEDERFFQSLQTLVGCGLSGPTSPLAFAEAVLGAIGRSAGSVQNKEQLLRMWSVMVCPLTDTITQSNEVNQGDALEHNFSAMHSALLFPITHLLPGAPLQQAAQKSMLSTWSKLYKVFARCSALVVTAEENICCEELCAKMAASIDKDALKVPSTLNAVASLLQVVVECVDFSPYTPQFQQKLKSPHTPMNWMKKKNKTLGNLSTFQSLLVQSLEVYLEDPEASSSSSSCDATGVVLVSVLSVLFTNLVIANAVQETLTCLIQPLTLFYKQAASEPPTFTSQLLAKLEKLLGDVLGCLQSRSALAYDDELLSLLSPLLCVLFTHKNKQLRTSVTQFWNSTFANSNSLSYPDDIRPILSQVKQKIPIILPGFEAVTVSDELSGQYSSENSQLETKLSGMPVSSAGKRDSLLGKAAELKDRSSAKTPKPVSTKLDFSSPKPPRREALEEEASIDFVFIPPETKERVLTEHQKEVKRTKRVDIPAMYNNLDASLDTAVFSQYTQSQEDSLYFRSVSFQVPQEDVENEEDIEILSKDTQDFVTEDKDVQCKEGSSPNVSGSSDLVTGTPQKPNSRRQSFITLEKYAEGKSSSPSSASKFTGPLMKTSNSQELSNSSKTSSSPASQTPAGPNSQASQSTVTGKRNSQHPVSSTAESPRRPKDSGVRSEPVRLTERLPSDTTEDEDVIPDTQAHMESKERTEKSSASEEMKPSSQEEEMDDSQASLSQTPSSEPRRSGRSRVRPLLPGDDPEEQEDKYTLNKRRRSGEEPKSDSQKSSPVQSRPNTRSKQKKVLPEKEQSSQTLATQELEEQTQKDEDELKKDSQVITPSPQTGGRSQEFDLVEQAEKDGDKPKKDSPVVSSQTAAQSQEFELTREGTDDDLSQEDSQVITPSSSESQSRRRSGRSKASSEAAEPEDKSDGKDSLRRQSWSNSQAEARIGGRTRRSKVHKGLSKSSPSSTPESSQSLDDAGSAENSQGRGRYSRRRSSQALVASVQSSESESPEVRENSPMPKKRGRKPRALLPSPLSLESKDGINNDVADSSQKADAQSIETDNVTDLEESQESQDLQGSESLQVTGDAEEQSNKDTPVEAEVDASESVAPEKTEIDDTNGSSLSPHKTEQSDSETNADNTSSQKTDTGDLEMLESTGISNEEIQEELPGDPAAEDTPAPPGETTEKPQVSESSEDKAEEVSETDSVKENQKDDSASDHQDDPVVPVEDTAQDDQVDQEECPSAADELSKEDELSVSNQHPDASTEDEIAPLQEEDDDEDDDDDDDEDGKTQVIECQDEEKTQMGNADNDVALNLETALTDLCDTSALVRDSTSEDVFQGSPVKQKDLEAVMASDIGQSPSSGRTRGTWSPSASPSTSILKKGQKRPLEEETPSPLVKSRRVSFANPIQQQEMADDIDRRSPAVRTSSPRRSKGSSIPQPKYVTTPTKGLLILSPRNLRSPGYKSSKKCLISEMGQEPRPVPRDCIYPALVGCSTPVEAVLPQISSNMWSRGFGQLVRARNIKTVGDLSALTPSEIKTLPIRSPKISNVKKALRTYEQQRKGRGGDELKSFDEMEMMTSELEETSAAQNQDEEDKMSGETLGVCEDTASSAREHHRSEGQLPPNGLLSEVEALTCRMTPPQLSRCSPQQLVQMHDQLGGMMRRVVVELLVLSRMDDAQSD
uniref:Replication timing regulatory factor 1 n=1 Tax=Seriola dumerili TaxID=41447 RepID=A0A3B4UTQ9_SERDU